MRETEEIGRCQLSYGELIRKEELQRLQDGYCQATGIFAYCLDRDGEKLTNLSGSPKETALLERYVNEERIRELLERVKEGSIEEMAVEELNVPNMKAAVISVRINGKTVLNWVVFGMLSDAETLEAAEAGTEGFTTVITWEHFYQTLDLLREASIILLQNKVSCFSAEAESRRSRFAEVEMSETLRTIEVTTEIVQLLDSDEQIEIIMDKLLRILGKHLQFSCGQVLQRYAETKEMDVICEWCNTGVVSYFEKSRKLPAFSFLNPEKPFVFSSESAGDSALLAELGGLGITAVAVFPVLKQDDAGTMFLCFSYTEDRHSFSTSEIKFLADAVKVLQSILTRQIQQNSIVSSYEALEAILDNVGCAIYVKDEVTGSMLFANRRLKSVFNKELQDGSFDQMIAKGIPRGMESGAYEINYLLRQKWYDLFYKEISWVDGRRASLYSLYDITDKKLYQKKIEQQAYTDFLTGLYNRMCCERDLAWHIDEAVKNQETGALLYLDLDDFKHINDGLGHQYGDALLKAISHSLRRIEGIRKTCYRMGGDEFVIIIPPEVFPRFEQIMDDIRKIFSQPWFLKDADYYCTMSMGIVTFPDSGEDSVADLIKKADIAMYEAKKGGKNRVARYSDNIDSVSGRRLDMEKNMRDATVEGYKEFEIYFQPIIDIQDGACSCAGAEALIRWNSENLGFIPPSEFIPLAEYLGLINPIGNYVLQEACRYCKQWNDNGYPDYKVNVNLSVVQLLQVDIVETVKHTLEESGIHPANLTLEVTESLAINDMERMKEILSRIKELGVKIALDDFGTGYSSLNHIREIPFDVIKVDQSFVRDLTEDPYSQSFIKMVAELAETIGVSVCVEGIETSEQYKVLQGMKVKYIQGYYFDRPMEREIFEEKYVTGIVKTGENV